MYFHSLRKSDHPPPYSMKSFSSLQINLVSYVAFRFKLLKNTFGSMLENSSIIFQEKDFVESTEVWSFTYFCFICACIWTSVASLQNKKVLAFTTLSIERWKISVLILDIYCGILQEVEKKISLACTHVLKRLLSAGPLEILIISDYDLIGRFLSKYRCS